MFRFQLLYRNPHLLRQFVNFSLKTENIRSQFIRTIVNGGKEDRHEINTTSKADVAALRHLVNEQVSLIIGNKLNLYKNVRFAFQADVVRKLKEHGTSEAEMKSAIDELLRRKKELSATDGTSALNVSLITIIPIFIMLLNNDKLFAMYRF